MPNIYDPVDVLTNAIFGQESDWNPNAKTSITGARGIGQIQPQTWKQYAYPGENINNSTDNAAVGRRIISDLYDKFGFDPARIATGYFSGPGNVTPTNSTIPYRQDKTDPTGKTTSSYVRDVTSRVNKLASDQPVSANDILSAFEKTSKPQSQGAVSGEDILKQFQSAQPPEKPSGSNIPVPPEQMTPPQLAEYKAGLARAVPNPSNLPPGLPSFLAENYHPLSAMVQTAQAGGGQFTQGLSEILKSRSASGLGNVGMGGLNATLGALVAPYNETMRAAGQVIGQPHAAEVAGLVAPVKGVPSTVMKNLPTARSADQIIKLVGEENLPSVIKKLENNPNLSLMDVSQPVKTVAAGLANSPETPAAQNIMRGAYESRTAARKDIIQQAIDKTLGPPINVKNYIDQLKENVRKVGQERINPAIEGAQPIGVKPLVDRLDNVIKSPGTSDDAIKRLSKLRDQITSEAGKDGFIDPQKLHGIQWRLRAEAENLARPMSTGAERNLSNPLFDARNDMVNAIDAASGGKYKPALAGFRDEAHVQDAFDKGYEIFANKKGVEDFPEYWNAWVKDAQPAERAAAKVGALTAARKEIEGYRTGASKGENILGTTFNKDKVASLFGPQQTEQLSGLLEDARSMAETNTLLYQQSKTGLVQAGREYFKPREVGKTGGISGTTAGVLGSMLMSAGMVEPGLLGLGLGAASGVRTGIQALGRMSDKGTATKFAKLASASEGPTRNELLRILRVHPAASGNKSGNLVPSLVRLAAP